jgi:hypothetical protein
MSHPDFIREACKYWQAESDLRTLRSSEPLLREAGSQQLMKYGTQSLESVRLRERVTWDPPGYTPQQVSPQSISSGVLVPSGVLVVLLTRVRSCTTLPSFRTSTKRQYQGAWRMVTSMVFMATLWGCTPPWSRKPKLQPGAVVLVGVVGEGVSDRAGAHRTIPLVALQAEVGAHLHHHRQACVVRPHVDVGARYGDSAGRIAAVAAQHARVYDAA